MPLAAWTKKLPEQRILKISRQFRPSFFFFFWLLRGYQVYRNVKVNTVRVAILVKFKAAIQTAPWLASTPLPQHPRYAEEVSTMSRKCPTSSFWFSGTYTLRSPIDNAVSRGRRYLAAVSVPPKLALLRPF